MGQYSKSCVLYNHNRLHTGKVPLHPLCLSSSVPPPFPCQTPPQVRLCPPLPPHTPNSLAPASSLPLSSSSTGSTPKKGSVALPGLVSQA
jgi:hypothetical protein